MEPIGDIAWAAPMAQTPPAVGLTDMEVIQYLLTLGESEGKKKMKGTIRPTSRESKCPACGKKFIHVKKLGYACPDCKTTPNRYYIDIHLDGDRPRIGCDQTGQAIDSYQRAQGLLAKIRAEIDSHTFDPSRYVTSDLKKFWVKTILQLYLEHKKDDIAPSYWKDYKRCAFAAETFFNTADVRDIRKLELIAFKKFVKEGFKPAGKTAKAVRKDKTVKNYLDWFLAFMNYCKDDLEVIDRVPPFPEVVVDEPEWRWLAPETQVTVLSDIPEGDRPIIMFLMLHGCRPGEARALKAKRVDLGTMSVEIRETYSGTEIRPRRKGKRSKPYSLPIHPEMADFFTERVKNSLPEAFIFTNPRNGLPYSMSALGRLWASVRDKMNLSKDLRLYDLTRHSVGSQLGSTGVGLEAIRDILGHSSSSTTERYVHHEKLEMKRGVLSKLSLKGAPGGLIDIKRPASRSG